MLRVFGFNQICLSAIWQMNGAMPSGMKFLNQERLQAAVASVLSVCNAEADPPLPGADEVGEQPGFVRSPAQDLGSKRWWPVMSEAGSRTHPPRCHLHQRAHAGCKRCAQFKIRHLSEGCDRALSAEEERSGANVQLGSEAPEELVVGFTPKLRSQILQSTYFRSVLQFVSNVESLIDELINHADHAEPYTPNSITTPSTLFCCVYRLAQLQPLRDQMLQFLGYKGSPIVRAAGLLHIRFNFLSRDAWSWLRNLLFDTEVFRPSSNPSSATTTIGEWVEHLLRDDKYFETVLPRLPIGLKREMAPELLQLPQLRQAAHAKQRGRVDQRQVGTKVDVLRGTMWRSAAILSSSVVGRSLLLDVQLEDGSMEEVPIGLVRMQEKATAKPRSRSPRMGSPTSEVKLCEEYLRRDREKAVAEAKHEYFKPIPKLKKMLTTKDKSLRHVAPDEGRAAPVAKPAKEEQPGAVPEAILPVSEAQLQRRQQLLEVVRKYSSRSASRAREDRLEYHEWGHAKSGAEVLAPDTMRLG
ncbi:unnamed protein product [Effrenium voratum]|nr:unnamed protein product [Effrenium voratum]